jgi:hypothetical protein
VQFRTEPSSGKSCDSTTSAMKDPQMTKATDI